MIVLSVCGFISTYLISMSLVVFSFLFVALHLAVFLGKEAGWKAMTPGVLACEEPDEARAKVTSVNN